MPTRRAKMSTCYGKNNVTLVIRHHLVLPDEPDDLFRLLLQLCAHHVEVRPLSSGKSGAVSGEVSAFHMHASFTLTQVCGRWRSTQVLRSPALQYAYASAARHFSTA